MTDTWTWATVTQATPLRIKVDGDTSALDATTDNLVGSLAVLDRVRVHLHSDGIIVTGIQGGNDKVYMVAHPETDLPGAYPEGITMSDTSGGGWPSSYATVVTTAVSLGRTSQVVYEKAGPERQWWRTGLGTTWTAWKEIAAYESGGQLKAADGVAADDVATVGQLNEAASLPDAVDLDDYTTPGLWHQDANTQAATGTNYPTPHAGLLEVFSVEGSYPFYYQRYTTYGTQIAVYQRTFYDGTWYGWNLVGGNDTGWVDITINSGFAYASYAERPRVRKMNGVIYLFGSFSNEGMSINNRYDAGQLPSWAYPEANSPMAAGGSEGNRSATLFVVRDGLLQIRTGSVLGGYYGIGGHSWPAI